MNLLTEPLLRVQTDTGPRSMSLPELMEALGADHVQHLPGLQRHQEDPFHVFLCSLAAAVLARRGDINPVQPASYWESGLRALAGDQGDEAWTLVVDDLARPAFMQPPLPKADWGKLRLSATTPDELDLLPTAKNHDLKRARASRPHIDEWIYSLVSLQTMSGFFGRGNPGISRMNSGFGNRPIVELIRDHRMGPRWRDALIRVLKHRNDVLSQAFGYQMNGLALVWTQEWDGETSLPLNCLDPNYVEICRRVRLREKNGKLWAESVPSNANRIDAKHLSGVVGDPWLPIDLGASPKALTITSQGLTADVLRRLIFADEIQLTPLQRPLDAWQGTVWLRISVLVRGQGTTDGYHERIVPIPASKQRMLFHSPTAGASLAAIAKTAIEYAGIMCSRVLRRSALVYLMGAPQKPQSERDTAQLWWQKLSARFDALWSDTYFPWLWSLPDKVDDLEAARDWSQRLLEVARQVLHEAEKALPQRTGRAYRAKVEAERAFWTSFYSEKHFGFLKEWKNERAADI